MASSSVSPYMSASSPKGPAPKSDSLGNSFRMSSWEKFDGENMVDHSVMFSVPDCDLNSPRFLSYPIGLLDDDSPAS
ncbi:hypothetical protein AA0498_2512 [Acidomonas methanolica]|nr:hypothetical protein AA0498_2512 [Acidomonas methanolica]